MTNVSLAADQVAAAAEELARAGRWQRSAELLDASTVDDPADRAGLAVTAAGLAVEGDWYRGTRTAVDRLAAAAAAVEAAAAEPAVRWDLEYAETRYAYADLLFVDGELRAGPWGKDPAAVAELRGRAEKLRADAPDDRRRGWAAMSLGLVLDNVCADRAAAPACYESALTAGESCGDDLLIWEALRHLGDHDHDRGDHAPAAQRWTRATEHAARAGTVCGTLAQQLLLAVLARDAGDEPGATALAREIGRWASALGAHSLAARTDAFLAGVDPTAPPEGTES